MVVQFRIPNPLGDKMSMKLLRRWSFLVESSMSNRALLNPQAFINVVKFPRPAKNSKNLKSFRGDGLRNPQTTRQTLAWQKLGIT